MIGFLIRRLLIAIPTILLISVFVFALQKLLPGDPVLAMAGEERDPAVLEFLREKYHLNDPLHRQYLSWIGGAVQGDLGVSLRTQQPVLTLIGEKLPVTIQLAVMALVIALVIGVPTGVISAYRKGSLIDWGANLVALSGLSIPNFWLGIMLILLVSVKWGLLPASGYVPLSEDPLQSIRTMIMPAFVLGTGLAATLMRHTRSAMLGVLRSDYVRTARAKGLTEKVVVLIHVLRNSLIPVVTVIALGVPTIFGGAIITEQVFKVNGLGQQLILSIHANDMPMVMTLTFIFAILIVLFNLVADLLYGILDPRIRYD